MNRVTEALDQDPVFVDPTGRRRRLLRNAGIVTGCLLAAYIAVVGFGLATDTRVPLTPWPEPGPPRHSAGPGPHGLMPKPGLRPAATAPAAAPRPSGTAPVARPSGGSGGTSKASPTRRATTSPAPSRTGKGRAYGRTKSPNPRRP